MIRVGLARCRPGYDGLEAPWGPGKSFPELERFFGDRAAEALSLTLRETLQDCFAQRGTLAHGGGPGHRLEIGRGRAWLGWQRQFPELRLHGLCHQQ